MVGGASSIVQPIGYGGERAISPSNFQGWASAIEMTVNTSEQRLFTLESNIARLGNIEDLYQFFQWLKAIYPNVFDQYSEAMNVAKQLKA